MENLIVLTGAIRLRVDGEVYELSAGDSVFFLADVPHVYENPGRIEARYTRVQAQFAALNAQAEENLAGIRVVKAYAQEDREIEAFRAASRAYADREMDQIRLSGLLWPLMGLLSGLATVMLLYVGGRDVVEGRLSLGESVQFGTYLTMLAWPMIALGWVMNLFQQGFASLRRVQEVLEAEPRIVDRSRPEAAVWRVRSSASEARICPSYTCNPPGASPGESASSRYSAPAAGPGATPERCMPTSRSKSTSIVTPAAAQSAESRRIAPASSAIVENRVPGNDAASRAKRRALGPTG